jgi:hypothetical protein
MPLEKNIFDQLASHICTASFNSRPLTKQWLLKAFLRGSNRWNVMEQGQVYMMDVLITQHSCWSISTVWTTHLWMVVLGTY